MARRRPCLLVGFLRVVAPVGGQEVEDGSTKLSQTIHYFVSVTPGLALKITSSLYMLALRTTNYGFIITRRRQDDSSVSGSPTLSVPLAKMQEALRVCLQLDLRGRQEKSTTGTSTIVL